MKQILGEKATFSQKIMRNFRCILEVCYNSKYIHLLNFEVQRLSFKSASANYAFELPSMIKVF